MNPAIITMIVAWVFVIIWISGVINFQRKHHPASLFYLFFTELWERFSYYGMRALLIYYMTRQLLYVDAEAYGIYGAYVSLVYATPVLGGFLADRYLGSRNAIMLGAILMALGHFTLAIENDLVFFAALGFLVIGNGFFKPNISTLVGKLYPEDDPRKDSAFTLFYMGINTGAFLTPLTCGTIGELYGWHYGFGLAGIGMVLGLIIFSIGNHKGLYEDKGLPPNPALLKQPFFLGLDLKTSIYTGAFVSVALFAFLVNHNAIANWILYIATGGVLLYLFVLSLKEDKNQKEQLWVILILFIFTTMFWTFFELAGSVIALFTLRNVDLVTAFSDEPVPASAFQAVNPFFIIILAPLFSWLWETLAKRNKDLSSPFKFAIGLFSLGIGFGFLVWGAKVAGPDALAPLIFLVLAYLFHTTGELCLSPIGLSLVTKLSPGKIVALVMGVWLMSTSVAGIIGAEIGKFTTIPETVPGESVPPEVTLPVYSNVFESIAYISIASAVLLVLFVPLLKRWMHEVK